jgi:hypothetical protein
VASAAGGAADVPRDKKKMTKASTPTIAPPAAIQTSRSAGREAPGRREAPQARQKLPEAGAPHEGHFASTGVVGIGEEHQYKEARIREWSNQG